MDTVLITDQPYHVGNGPSATLVHQYQAWCKRCMTQVQGPAPQFNRVWTTKAPAVKAANAHLDAHAYRDTYIERMAGHGLKVVDTVTR